MHSKQSLVMAICATLVSAVLMQSSVDAAECNVNAIPNVPDVKILSADAVSTPADHCRVVGEIGAETGFALLLPDNWNGKFVMGGSGGFAGGFANGAQDLPNVIGDGWATVATDTGHKGHPGGASWALNNLERQVNFGHLAAHRTAVTAKQIIKGFYGRASSRDLFFGCSRGGGQALMMAQRSPELFDGIYAGAPAYSWTKEMAGRWARNAQIMYPDPNQISAPVIDADALEMLGNAVMEQCDTLDGLKDGILNDPRQCEFDVSSLECGTEKSNQCLSKVQVAAAEAIYSTLDFGGTEWPGTPYGAELPGNPLGWDRWVTGGFVPDEDMEFHPGAESGGFEAPETPNARWAFATEMMKYFFYADPDWTYENYEFSDFSHHAARLAPVLNADDPDLSDFRARGGKLIIDNGWMDASLTAYGTLDYYESVITLDETARNDVRLFLRPGVTHCIGGPGPYGTDYIAALETWLDTGVAPEQLDAPFVLPTLGLPPSGQGGRIICAHPGVVTYEGTGDSNDPKNFSCKIRK